MNTSILNYQTMRLFLEGKREGKIDALIDLCNDGLIDMETAADKLNMTIEAFETLFNLRKPISGDAEEKGEST
ncbi:MAG: hypothetical protein K5696_11060 [Lachnospiraceae bacterium]|nr:hypothetical protein [Lachnospiraceae bacterium]